MKCYEWSDLRVGLREQFRVQVTTAMMDGFGEISGDLNPLHRDQSFAVTHGFKDTVVYGLLISMFYSQLVGVHLPGRYALLHGIDIDFVAPAYPGDILNVSGEIIYLNESCRRIEMRASIVDQGGTSVSKAKLRVGLLKRDMKAAEV
jgi:3-hydroxybutyryl-CoA dehydratase